MYIFAPSQKKMYIFAPTLELLKINPKKIQQKKKKNPNKDIDFCERYSQLGYE